MQGYDKLNDMNLLDLLYTEEELLPRAVVDEFVRRGERVIDLLADTATDQHGWRSDGPDWWPGIHAVYILAAIGTERTVIPLLQSLRNAVSYDCEFVFMDMAAVFGSIGPAAVNGLRHIASDRSSDWLVRSVAIEGLAAITIKAPELETTLFEFIRSVLTDPSEDRIVRAGAAHVLLDFLREEAYDDLLAFGREERKLKKEDRSYAADFYDSDVEKAFARKQKELEMYTRDWLTFYDDDAVTMRRERRREVFGEDEEVDGEFDDLFREDGPVLPEPPRVGRNAPCPCGSGKKYKKCCAGTA